jgi:adenine deaminase
VGEEYEAVEDVADQIGLTQKGLMDPTFLSLEVIPEYRLTNNGLVDVKQMAYVDVVV